MSEPDTEPEGAREPQAPPDPHPPQQHNPYTDDVPLQVRDHPWRENRVVVGIAAAIALAPLLWLLIRLVIGATPLITDDLLFALLIGEPLALAVAMFPVLISSGVRLSLGSTTMTRKLRTSRGETKTIRLADIRAGIYASKVRYRREYGKELVLFLDGGEILWIADGIDADDVAKVATALSEYGVREYAEPITSDQLTALARKARRGDGAPPPD